MKRLILFALFPALACLQAADVTGSWSGSYYAGPIYLVLKQQGTEVTGTAGPSASQQMLKLAAGKLDGENLTFKVGPLEVNLRLQGDDLKGELKEPNDTAPLVLTRVEALARRAPDTSPAKPFDVASIKVNKSGGNTGITGRGGQIRPSKGQIAMENVTLWKALGFAHGIGEDKDYAITGPDWLKTERYDIVGKIPPGTTFEQMRRMLQATLTERFKLGLHRETKEMPIYALVVGREGLKIKETEMGHGGFSFGRGHIEAKSGALVAFADRLSQMLDRPVIDYTNTPGVFNFTLDWSPDQPMTNPAEETANPAGPSIFTAVQQQLGLRLEARRGPVDVLVIDRGDRVPIEN
jgi:uncharacterized protein (TIGR03435 family)